ncbi:hypothetical protein [Kangiella sp. TOML190]|uniref:hypothetical protein n=1 Tax=Kangiella sp. TOML190 TaxID=2931351 RepID=UPI00203BDEA3|nr:hypothetical protein [Kangiella sp. TOML190]
MADNRDRAALIAEAKAKNDSCRRVRPVTSASEQCSRQCGGAVGRGGITLTGSSESAQKSIQLCREAHAAVGFSTATPPNLEPTEQEKINAMPSNASFCQQKAPSIKCGYGDFSDRNGLCASLRACATSCVKPNVKTELESRRKIVRVKARKAIEHCYDAYTRTKALLTN